MIIIINTSVDRKTPPKTSVKEEMIAAMRLSARRKTALEIDDYLDLLNLATRLDDVQWQKEIVRKLELMQTELAESRQQPLN